MKLESEFYDLAKKINKRFSVIPILFGSLGLQLLVDDAVNPGDIDIGIPEVIFSEKWQDIAEFMQGEGYTLINKHEGEFHKGEVMVEICDFDEYKEFADLSEKECPIVETDGAIYKLLTLEQCLVLYTGSLELEHRDNKDQPKIDVILKALARTK
jgi:hypothetical protein